jgi:hypothetical protein
MEIEIEKLKKLIESERNRQSHSGVQPYSEINRQSRSGVQPYNYMSMQ